LFHYKHEPEIRLALLCLKKLQYYERGLNYESNLYFILEGVDELVAKYGISNIICRNGVVWQEVDVLNCLGLNTES